MSSSRAPSRPASSSTPISSRKPALRDASAIASKSRPARKRRTWIATTSRRSSASRRRRCASSRPRSAAASAQSWTFRFSLSSRLPRGICDRPVRMVYSRPESIMTTTKRHPARIRARVGATRDGQLTAMDFSADFNTGAYASWGPTVANRVPVHASGPYLVPHYRAVTRAVHTHLVPAGAFRGFGVPQAAIAQEQLFDELAEQARPRPARISHPQCAGGGDADGHRPGLRRRRGIQARASKRCDRAGAQRARTPRRSIGAAAAPLRRGVGVAGMWYGCGNTSLSNPSTMRRRPEARRTDRAASGRRRHRAGLEHRRPADLRRRARRADRRASIWSRRDTAITPDCGKTSASRQTFVTGKAAASPARAMRARDPATGQRRRVTRRIGFEHGAVDRHEMAGGERRSILRDIAARRRTATSLDRSRRPSIRRPRRSTKTARASPMRCSVSARISPRSRSISNSARVEVLQHHRRA